MLKSWGRNSNDVVQEVSGCITHDSSTAEYEGSNDKIKTTEGMKDVISACFDALASFSHPFRTIRGCHESWPPVDTGPRNADPATHQC